MILLFHRRIRIRYYFLFSQVIAPLVEQPMDIDKATAGDAMIDYRRYQTNDRSMR